MSLLREVEWEPCLLEARPDPTLARELRQRYGRVSPSMAYFYPCPTLLDSLVQLSALNLARVELDHSLLDMVAAVVSQDHSCRYCYALLRAVMRASGMREERIRQIAQDVMTADLTEKERAALAFARRVSRSNPLASRADTKRLEEVGFTDVQIREIAGTVALNVFFNRLSTLPALPPGAIEDLPDRWYVRAVRPLLARYLDRLRFTAKPKYLSDEEKNGPYAPVIRAMDGLPVARVLRQLIDALLSGPALPLRTKALVFAVVGRALACERSVAEGTRLAIDAGVSAETITETLDHLTAPGLTAEERLLIPLARETVWYEPAPIQRRMREVGEVLSRPQLIEFIVAASTANTVCRLGSVVVDP